MLGLKKHQDKERVLVNSLTRIQERRNKKTAANNSREGQDRPNIQ